MKLLYTCLIELKQSTTLLHGYYGYDTDRKIEMSGGISLDLAYRISRNRVVMQQNGNCSTIEWCSMIER